MRSFLSFLFSFEHNNKAEINKFKLRAAEKRAFHRTEREKERESKHMYRHFAMESFSSAALLLLLLFLLFLFIVVVAIRPYLLINYVKATTQHLHLLRSSSSYLKHAVLLSLYFLPLSCDAAK